MSRGPGKIERAIQQLMDSQRNWAWTIEELAEKVYHITRVEKKHRVSVLRAVRRVEERDTDWGLLPGRGNTLVLCNTANL